MPVEEKTKELDDSIKSIRSQSDEKFGITIGSSSAKYGIQFARRHTTRASGNRSRHQLQQRGNVLRALLDLRHRFWRRME